MRSRHFHLPLLALWVVACSSSETPLGPDGAGGSGGLAEPLPQVTAGTPEDACGDGFDHVVDHCEPILPSLPCPEDTMPRIGDATCSPVTACTDASGTVDAWVDAAFAGSSDGSAEAPWTSLQDALVAASPGDRIAVAAGRHGGAELVLPPEVSLIGRCPAETVIEADLRVPSGSDGVRLERLTLEGRVAVYGEASLSSTVVVDQLDVEGGGIAAVEASDVERLFLVEGAEATIRDSHTRGMALTPLPGDERRPRLEVHRSIVAGYLAIGGGTALVEQSAFLGHVAPMTSDAAVFTFTLSDGENVYAWPHDLVVRQSAFVDYRMACVAVYDGDVSVETSWFTRCGSSSDEPSAALSVRNGVVALASSVVEDGKGTGVLMTDAEGELENIIVRRVDAVGGLYGDGIASVSLEAEQSLVLRESIVRNVTRAGISSHGSMVDLDGVLLLCNPIDLDVAPSPGPVVSDGGFMGVDATHCHCDGTAYTCAARSSQLEPPPAIEVSL